MSPILLKAKPGDEVNCDVQAVGPPEKERVEFRTGWPVKLSDPVVDWRPAPKFHDAANFQFTKWSLTAALRVPVDAKPGRYVIPITVRGPFGEVADPFLAVDVE